MKRLNPKIAGSLQFSTILVISFAVMLGYCITHCRASDASMQDLSLTTALVKRPPSVASTSPSDDEQKIVTGAVLYKIDEDFFKTESSAEWGVSAISSALGLIPSNPSCGLLLYNIGNLLRLEKASIGADALIIWWVISSTAPFMHQFGSRANTIYKAIFQPSPYTFKKDELSEWERQPVYEALNKGNSLLFEPNMAHKLLKASSLASCLINASVPLLPLFYVEEQFPLFVATTAPAFFGALLEHGYTVAEERLRDVFSSRIYPLSNVRLRQRDILSMRLNQFRNRISQDDEFASSAYQAIEQRGQNFRFSALFMTKDRGDPELAGETDRLWNERADVEELPRASIRQSAIAALTHGIIHLGQYPRFRVTQYFLSTALTWAGLDENTASWVSYLLAGFGTVHRYLTEYGVHIKNSSTLSHHTDHRTLRKAAKIPSVINASLLSLIYYSMGLEAFANEAPVSKAIWLGSGFALDFSYFLDFFDRHTNGMITGVATMPCIKSKKTILDRHVQNAEYFIHNANDRTIEELYREVFVGL